MTNRNPKKIVAARHKKIKELILEQLRKVPLLTHACARVQIGKTTLHRLRKQDAEFDKAVETAIVEGTEFLCEMSEGQLISLVKDGHFAAIKLYLQVHNPKYSRKVELSGKVEVESQELTDEEKQIIDKALRAVFQDDAEKDDKEKGDEVPDNDEHGQ